MSASVNWSTGRLSSISGVQLQLTTVETTQNGVKIIAFSGNPGTVYVGETGLTTDSADNTDGYPLTPGSSVTLNIRHPSDIYVKANTGTTNKLWYILD